MIGNANFLVFSAKPAVINQPNINIPPEVRPNRPAILKQSAADSWSSSNNPFTEQETQIGFQGKNHLLKIMQDFQNNPPDVQKNGYVKKVCDNLLNLLAEHNPYTADHSRQVAGIATQFAKSLKLTPKDIEEIEAAALLHDIGKIFTPKNILNKSGKLTDKEKVIMDQHASQGEKFLEQLGLTKNSSFKDIAAMVGSHHSPVNKLSLLGNKKSKENVLEAADVYNALTTKRAYKPALSPREAIETMKKMQGKNKKWNPDIFNKFERFIEQNYIFKEKIPPVKENPFKQSANIFA